MGNPRLPFFWTETERERERQEDGNAIGDKKGGEYYVTAIAPRVVQEKKKKRKEGLPSPAVSVCAPANQP